MYLRKTQSQLQEDFNRTGYQFLIVDLEAALAFAERASNQRTEPETRMRNVHNARRAYDAVMRLRPKFSLTSEQQRTFQEKLSNLKAVLERMGESLETS